jgi:hypothetical protein
MIRHGTSQDIAAAASAQSGRTAEAATGTAHPGVAAGEEAPRAEVIGVNGAD